MAEKKVADLLNPPLPNSQFSSLLEGSLEGFARYCVLMTAWETGIFDRTESPKTPKELAAELGYNEAMTAMFCAVLEAMGLLVKNGDAYSNSRLSEIYLSRFSAYCMAKTMQRAELRARHWLNLKSILREGPVKEERKGIFDASWLVSIAEWAETGSVSRVMEVVSSNLEIGRWRKMLDIGGGHGLYAIAFAASNPELEAFVFDLPHVMPVAQRYIEAYSADRVRFIPGDFLKDDIGNGYDAIFSSFNQSCHDPKLIPKLAGALKPGGDLILRRFKDVEAEDPLKILEWNLVSFDGKKIGSKPHSCDSFISREEYVGHLRGTGLSVIKVVDVDKMSEIIFAKAPESD